MRTSVIVDDQILTQARRKARELGLTLSAYITLALQRDLTSPPVKKRKPFRLVTVKGGRLQPGFSWNRLEQQLNDLEDGARVRGSSGRK